MIRDQSNDRGNSKQYPSRIPKKPDRLSINNPVILFSRRHQVTYRWHVLSGIACPKCGTNNPATARYCSMCGNLLAPVPPAQTVTPSLMPSVPVTTAPSAYYGYVASYYETARATAIDRIKNGLMLLVIGLVISWIPTVGAVGVFLELSGAILVILGRHTFGPDHARNVLLSIIIFVIAVAVVVAAAIFTLLSELLLFPPRGPLVPASFFGGFLVALL